MENSQISLLTGTLSIYSSYLLPNCVLINIWSCIFYFVASFLRSILLIVGAYICFSVTKPFLLSFIYSSSEFLERYQRTGVDLFHFNQSVRNCAFSTCTKCDRHHSVCFTYSQSFSPHTVSINQYCLHIILKERKPRHDMVQ